MRYPVSISIGALIVQALLLLVSVVGWLYTNKWHYGAVAIVSVVSLVVWCLGRHRGKPLRLLRSDSD